MKDIKSALNYQEANLTSFNDSINQLTAHLEEHKNQTAAELVQLQTTQSSLTQNLDSLKLVKLVSNKLIWLNAD